MAVAMGAAALVVLGLTGCGPTSADPAATAVASETPDASQTPAASAAPDASDPPATGPTIPPGATAVPAPGAGATPGPDGPTEAAALPTTTAALDEAITFDTGIVVEIVAVDPITVTAETPGEMDGPALRVSVAARNQSGEAQEVDSAVVTLVTDDGQVGVGTTAGSPSPLSGMVEPGATVSGTYVFMLDPASGRDVTVTVNYAAGEPLAVFTGRTP
ncbi:hypothetical protein ABIB37_002000 [Agrococcus sp. UYP10]|uniref:hypothetical protein n=1 Tax=Agrococcus sp. UYP10 TaxID=1756355 RepID=UPI003393DE6D